MSNRIVFPMASGASALSSAAANSVKNWIQEKERKSYECENDFVRAEDLKAKKGDMIEIKRDHFSHWGIYVGDGEIIHLVNVDGQAIIKCEQLIEYVQTSLCRVNNLAAAAKRRGLEFKCDEDIVKAAYSKLNEPSEMKYDLLEHNCEYFATECFFGIGFSEQADTAKNNALIHIGAKLGVPQSMGSI